jgi:hypothetical protein
MSKGRKKNTQIDNFFTRSKARGVEARGTTQINSHGKFANEKAKQKKEGTYRVSFTEVFDRVTEKDIQLRKQYALNLISTYLYAYEHLLHLEAKTKEGKQTASALDEVFYVKFGKEVLGKVSIRTQRGLRFNSLYFVFQQKHTNRPPSESYKQDGGYKKATKSRQSDQNRRSARKRAEGGRRK